LFGVTYYLYILSVAEYVSTVGFVVGFFVMEVLEVVVGLTRGILFDGGQQTIGFDPLNEHS